MIPVANQVVFARIFLGKHRIGGSLSRPPVIRGWWKGSQM